MIFRITMVAVLSIGLLPCWAQQQDTAFESKDAAGRSWKISLNRAKDQNACEVLKNLQPVNLSQLITLSAELWYSADPDDGGKVSWEMIDLSDYKVKNRRQALILESPEGTELTLKYHCDRHHHITAKLMVK